jgi:hypothetical protein
LSYQPRHVCHRNSLICTSVDIRFFGRKTFLFSPYLNQFLRYRDVLYAKIILETKYFDHVLCKLVVGSISIELRAQTSVPFNFLLCTSLENRFLLKKCHLEAFF